MASRRFMFNFVSTFRVVEIVKMVQIARKNRSVKSPDDENDLMNITKQHYDDIKTVALYKCKITLLKICQIVHKGKASQMLKRSAKLAYNKKPVKFYQLNIESLQKNDEENKEEYHIQ